MNMINQIIVFMIGATVGTLSHYIGFHMSIFKKKSTCLNCQIPLKISEQLPLISYVWLKGRCRYCHQKINVRYLFVEIVSGLLFLYPTIVMIDVTDVLVAWLLLSVLLIVTISDLYHQLVSDSVLVCGGILIAISYIFSNPTSLLLGIVEGCLAFFIMLMCAYGGQLIFKKETIGGGDIKLYALVGFVLGIKGMLLSVFLASVMALGFLTLFTKDKQKPLPFVPFIAISSYICFLYSYELMTLYFG